MPDVPWVDNWEACGPPWPAFVLGRWPWDRAGAFALGIPWGTWRPAETAAGPLDTTGACEVPCSFEPTRPVVVAAVELEVAAFPRAAAPECRMAIACSPGRAPWARVFFPPVVDGFVTPTPPESLPDDGFSAWALGPTGAEEAVTPAQYPGMCAAPPAATAKLRSAVLW